VRAIRAALEAASAPAAPAIPLRLDANQAWDPRTALAILQDLAGENIQFCEQPGPYWDLDGMKWLRRRSPLPVMADESLFGPHEAYQLAKMGACDYFNIKLAKCGGIHGALQIDAIAESAGIACMLGGMAETRLGVSAAAHCVAARPNLKFADLDSICHYRVDPYTSGVVFEGAQVIIPDLPGHGANLPQEYLDGLEGISLHAESNSWAV
jgi:L-Ala-D/L-Glu epimerase